LAGAAGATEAKAAVELTDANAGKATAGGFLSKERMQCLLPNMGLLSPQTRAQTGPLFCVSLWVTFSGRTVVFLCLPFALKHLFRLRTGHKWADMLLLLLALLCAHCKGVPIAAVLQWALSALLAQRIIPRASPLYAPIAQAIQAQKPTALLTADADGAFEPTFHAGRVQHGARAIAFFMRPEYIWLACVSNPSLAAFVAPAVKCNNY
jgi:hypothetical protein